MNRIQLLEARLLEIHKILFGDKDHINLEKSTAVWKLTSATLREYKAYQAAVDANLNAAIDNDQAEFVSGSAEDIANDMLVYCDDDAVMFDGVTAEYLIPFIEDWQKREKETAENERRAGMIKGDHNSEVADAIGPAARSES